MATFRQYLPMFIDHSDKDLETFEFETIDELKQELQNRNYVPDDYDLCCGDNTAVMIVTKPDVPSYKYYVIGFVNGFSLEDQLRKYDDQYYRYSKNPTVPKLTNDDKVNDLIATGVELYKTLDVNPPNRVQFNTEENIKDNLYHTYSYYSDILNTSFCCKFQHFYYIGEPEDIYYHLGLYYDALNELDAKQNNRHHTINTGNDTSCYLKNYLGTELTNRLNKIVDDYFNSYIKYECNKDDVKGQYNKDTNFGYWFKTWLFIRLACEFILEVCKELPKF